MPYIIFTRRERETIKLFTLLVGRPLNNLEDRYVIKHVIPYAYKDSNLKDNRFTLIMEDIVKHLINV